MGEGSTDKQKALSSKVCRGAEEGMTNGAVGEANRAFELGFEGYELIMQRRGGRCFLQHTTSHGNCSFWGIGE